MPQSVTIRRRRYAVQFVQTTDSNGYKKISRSCELYAEAMKVCKGKSDCRRFHVAVCYVAHGRPPGPVNSAVGSYTVDHKDGDVSNNNWRNLQWMKHSENVAKGNASRGSSKK